MTDINLEDINKSSNLSLFAEDDLQVKTFFMENSLSRVSITLPTKLSFIVPIIQIEGSTNPDNDIDDLALYLRTEKDNKVNEFLRVDSLISTNTTNLNQEIVNRISQGTTLDLKIDNEINRATIKENQLESELDAEVLNRKEAITTEQNTRQTAIDNLNTQLTNAINNETFERNLEINRIDGRINHLLDGTDIDTDQLKEIIDAYSLADTNILSQIATLQQRLTTIENRYNTTFPSSDPTDV
jgi:hypothetical protein